MKAWRLHGSPAASSLRCDEVDVSLHLQNPVGPLLTMIVILIACMLLGAFAYNVFVAEPARRAAASRAEYARIQRQMILDREQRYLLAKQEGHAEDAFRMARFLAAVYSELNDMPNQKKWKAIADAERLGAQIFLTEIRLLTSVSYTGHAFILRLHSQRIAPNG